MRFTRRRNIKGKREKYFTAYEEINRLSVLCVYTIERGTEKSNQKLLLIPSTFIILFL
jgi:hypothetical protein